jgi:cell division protein FtsZ
MTIQLQVPENIILKPAITVFGVGGAGSNAVNNMIHSKLQGARFVSANTDAQALEHSLAERRIQLGESSTRGLGAGAAPEVGRAAAEETAAEILAELESCHMVFITAGMGGGTGTGAAPVIAKMARDKGILTVGVVTKPFHFEGARRMRTAEAGLNELAQYVDTLIVIPNQNLFRIANEKTTFADAFKMADDVLHAGVRGITDLITMPGLINLDFADIVSVMSKMGKAMMGTGEADGEDRALRAAEAAISNPLLDNCSMKGARGVLINITGGMDMTLYEVDAAANRIREEVDADANIIFGSTFSDQIGGSIRVSVVATGIDAEFMGEQQRTYAAIPTMVATVSTLASAEAMPQHEPDFAVEEEQDVPTFSFAADEESERADEEQETQPAFVAPRPIEPRSAFAGWEQPEESDIEREHSLFSSTAFDAEGDTPSLFPVSADEREQARAGNAGLGLFERMANTVKVLGSGGQATPAAKEPVAEQEEHEDFSTSSSMREDVLDIPAFLRRKS